MVNGVSPMNHPKLRISTQQQYYTSHTMCCLVIFIYYFFFWKNLQYNFPILPDWSGIISILRKKLWFMLLLFWKSFLKVLVLCIIAEMIYNSMTTDGYPQRRSTTTQKKLLEEGENLYIATDEKPEIFEKEFASLFRNRYKLHSLSDFSHVITGVVPEWVPLIEMVILSQGRVFVGTRQSTFSGYVTRLRGYMKSVKNKEIYWTIKKYPEDYVNLVDNWKGWEREYPEAWETIMDDKK